MAKAMRWPQEDGSELVVLVMDDHEATYVCANLGGTSPKIHGLSPVDGAYAVLKPLLDSQEYEKHIKIARATRPQFKMQAGKTEAIKYGVITEDWWHYGDNSAQG